MAVVVFLMLSLVLGPTARADAPETGQPAFVELASDPLFDDDFDEAHAVYDPLEESNRDVLKGNRFVDRFLFDPLTAMYGKFLPVPLKQGIRNIFSNIDSPTVVVNDLLQLEWRDAGVATARLVTNSTVGLGGIFDVAERVGLAKHKSDFGQTLAMAGAPSGPFLVLPLLGPNTVRDTIGGAVDISISPATYVLGPVMLFSWGGGMGLVKREENYHALNALESSSIDFYSTLRSAYLQHRREEIWGRRRHRKQDAGEAAREAPP